MRKFLIGLLIGTFAFFFLLSVRADGLPFDIGETATSCKTLNAECNINESGKSCCAGLVCLDHGQPSEDGKCGVLPSATPLVTPSVSPSVTVTPTEIVQCPNIIENDCGIYVRQID